MRVGDTFTNQALTSRLRSLAWILLYFPGTATVMADDLLTLDDRRSGDYVSSLGTSWRVITDTVMGGVSSAELVLDSVDNRDCLRLRGEISLENNGGFVQAALDLEGTRAVDASAYKGLTLDVYGNNEGYNLHLRTNDVWLPWQSYRSGFQAPVGWHTIRLPFVSFKGYRIGSQLDLRHLKRIAIVAIGKAYKADLCVGSVALYR